MRLKIKGGVSGGGGGGGVKGKRNVRDERKE